MKDLMLFGLAGYSGPVLKLDETDFYILRFLRRFMWYFYSRGLSRLRSSQAAVIATMEPVVAAFLAYLFWQESLGLWGYAGACLVIGGVTIQAAAGRSG